MLLRHTDMGQITRYNYINFSLLIPKKLFSTILISTVTSYCPSNKDLIKIRLINLIERLGLAEHFTEEITTMLGQIFRYSGLVVGDNVDYVFNF